MTPVLTVVFSDLIQDWLHVIEGCIGLRNIRVAEGTVAHALQEEGVSG